MQRTADRSAIYPRRFSSRKKCPAAARVVNLAGRRFDGKIPVITARDGQRYSLKDGEEKPALMPHFVPPDPTRKKTLKPCWAGWNVLQTFS